MPKTRNSKGKGKEKGPVVQQPTPPTQDELSDSFDAMEEDTLPEKDSTELELEKLVFGDEKGFFDGLKAHKEDSIYPAFEDESDGGAIAESETEEQELDALEDADLFFIDSGPSTNPTQALVPITSASEEDDEFKDPNPPAWIDSDDERITVSLASNPRLRKLRITADEDSINGKEYTKRLRRQFERLYPVPEWADHSTSQNSSSRKKRRKLSNESYTSSSSSSDDDMTDDLSAQPLAKLLQSTTPLTTTASTTTRRKLRPEVIDIQRLKDIPDTQPSTITSLSFHPTLPILLSSCTSLLTLHHLSPISTSPNPKLTSLHIPHTPLTTTSFHPSGTRIFFSARRRYFHIWDLPSGSIQKVTRVYGHAEQQKSMERFKISGDGRWMGLVGTGRKGGSVNILDAGTSQWVCEARVEGRNGVADFEWWNDGNGLTILGKGGEAVEYSVLERKVIGRWQDEGAVGTTVVAMGGKINNPGKGAFGGDRYVAVGSQSGIVNIYDRSSWRVGTLSERPVPVKVLDQLFTPISHLTFSPDGQFLVMASRWKRDALRIVHLPSCTVYKNWPTSSTPLGRITAVAISPSSEMLAVANEQGKIRLWEIRA